MNEERIIFRKWKARNYVTKKNCSPGKAIKHMVLLQVIFNFGHTGQIIDNLNTCIQAFHVVLGGEPLWLCLLCQAGILCTAFRSPFPPDYCLRYLAGSPYIFWIYTLYFLREAGICVCLGGVQRKKNTQSSSQKLRSIFVFQSSLFSCEKPTVQNKKRIWL